MREPGDNKVKDAANFGLFKQNWGILRACASRAGFKGQSEANWNNGAKLKYVVASLSPLFPVPDIHYHNTNFPPTTSRPVN